MKYESAEMEWDMVWVDEDRRVTLAYKIAPGSPEYIPPYNRPELYDPGSGPDIEIEKATDAETGEELALSDALLREAETYIAERHQEEPFEPYEPDYER